MSYKIPRWAFLGGLIEYVLCSLCLYPFKCLKFKDFYAYFWLKFLPKRFRKRFCYTTYLLPETHMPDSSDPKNLTTSRGALRLQAYRRRLREDELVRTEIVLPKTAREAAQAIATAEGAGYLETVSALTQLGLEVYQQQASTNLLRSSLMGASFATASPEASVGPKPPSELRAMMAFSASVQNAQASIPSSPTLSVTPPNPGTTSPLSRFLKARKEGK
jgi:hypothetical protein